MGIEALLGRLRPSLAGCVAADGQPLAARDEAMQGGIWGRHQADLGNDRYMNCSDGRCGVWHRWQMKTAFCREGERC